MRCIISRLSALGSLFLAPIRVTGEQYFSIETIDKKMSLFTGSSKIAVRVRDIESGTDEQADQNESTILVDTYSYYRHSVVLSHSEELEKGKSQRK